MYFFLVFNILHNLHKSSAAVRAPGDAVTSFLVAPAVTPWETTLPGVMGGAGNNPCVRLVHYNRRTGQAVDVDQYYLDLKAANAAPPLAAANWTRLYRLTDFFRVTDASTASLNEIAERLLTEDDTFSQYYEINDARYEEEDGGGGSGKWTEDERTVHYCAVTCVDFDDYDACWRQHTADSVSGCNTYYRSSAGLVTVVVVAAALGLTAAAHGF